MKNRRLINFFTGLLLALFFQPTFVSGDTIYFDFDGNVIAKEQYQAIASDREKKLGMKLRNGYAVKFKVWKDPIKLRKKRIEQWRIMRSHYSPASLPIKIENSSTKNN